MACDMILCNGPLPPPPPPPRAGARVDLPRPSRCPLSPSSSDSSSGPACVKKCILDSCRDCNDTPCVFDRASAAAFCQVSAGLFCVDTYILGLCRVFEGKTPVLYAFQTLRFLSISLSLSFLHRLLVVLILQGASVTPRTSPITRSSERRPQNERTNVLCMKDCIVADRPQDFWLCGQSLKHKTRAQRIAPSCPVAPQLAPQLAPQPKCAIKVAKKKSRVLALGAGRNKQQASPQLLGRACPSPSRRAFAAL